MKVERTTGKEEIIKAVIECFDYSVEDDTDFSCFHLDVEGRCWLKATDNDELIGFYEIKPFNRSMLEVHPFILKDKRNKSFDSAMAVKHWFNSEQCPKMYHSLVTHAPSLYRHIKIFLLRVGFNQVGKYEKAFRKSGELYDLNLFQLNRGE